MPEPTVQPVRLTRSRRKGSKLVSPNGLPIVCVTRPGKWGNAFKGPRAVELSRLYWTRKWTKLAKHIAPNHDADHRAVLICAMALHQPDVRELRGKNLACWCKQGEPCHADVLLELANPLLATLAAPQKAGEGTK